MQQSVYLVLLVLTVRLLRPPVLAARLIHTQSILGLLHAPLALLARTALQVRVRVPTARLERIRPLELVALPLALLGNTLLPVQLVALIAR